MQELLQIAGRKLKPSEFAKVFFDFDPYPYQVKALDCTDRFTMLNWGRQTGKSTICAIDALYDALWNEGHTVVLLGPKKQHAQRLFNRVRNLLRISARKYPELEIFNNVTRETRTTYEFANDSSIECLTIGDDGGNIKGITAHKQTIDEVAQQKNEEAWSAINPMLIATHGSQRLISTPKGTNNHFFRCYKGGSHKYFHATSFDNPNADLSIIEADKIWMPDILWREEYLAEWIEESHVFFPIQLIDRSMNNTLSERYAPLENCTYYCGLDLASVGLDSTVFAILEEHTNWNAVVKYIEVKNEDPLKVLGRLRHLHEEFGFSKIFVDQTGMGDSFVPFAQAQNLPVEGIWQTQKEKQRIYQNLKNQMENGLSLLKHDQARKQMADIVWDYTLENSLKLYSQQSRNHNMPGGDDYPTAIALAALALQTPIQPIIAIAGKGAYGD